MKVPFLSLKDITAKYAGDIHDAALHDYLEQQGIGMLLHNSPPPVNKAPLDTKQHKKREANYIAPLQPLTLASVKTWGSWEGAGRVGLP